CGEAGVVEGDEDKIILLVDGEEALRASQAALLRELGYREVFLSGNGTEAWAMVKNFKVDCIISAWDLDEMTGLVLLKVVRADRAHSSIPFILVVEDVTRSQVIEAGESGVTDIIIRPFSKETFRRKLEQGLFPPEDPRTAESNQWYNQGLDLMKQGRYDEALTSFQRILNAQESAEVYYNLGYIRTAQGRYEEAILAFRRATEINNAFAKAYNKMGEVYALLGRADEAQRCFEKAAEIYMEKNQDDRAEAAFMQALEVNPNTLNVYNSLGILYRRQGKYQEAIRMYRKARRVNPYDEHIHYNLARVFMAVKDFKEAAQALRRAIEINPSFAEARNMLKSIEMGEGPK
ncbi:MAG: tetratricopeptide repeat protein, partial [Thermodesulfobacteriota bacterium]